MVKMKHLLILEKLVSLTMAFSMGFLIGMNYTAAPVIYLAAVIGICALAASICYWANTPNAFFAFGNPGDNINSDSI